MSLRREVLRWVRGYANASRRYLSERALDQSHISGGRLGATVLDDVEFNFLALAKRCQTRLPESGN
jgi:hypothetical protein